MTQIVSVDLPGNPRLAWSDLRRSEREQAYLDLIPSGTPVFRSGSTELSQGHEALSEDDLVTDLFIAGTGEEAAQAYEFWESRLARSAAVNFVDGEVVVPIRSRQAHYASRHQICGSNAPWHMTNTSEPHSDDMIEQASNPVSFDWMVKGVCGLRSVTTMMSEVERDQPFGSFFAFTELPDLPFVENQLQRLPGCRGKRIFRSQVGFDSGGSGLGRESGNLVAGSRRGPISRIWSSLSLESFLNDNCKRQE